MKEAVQVTLSGVSSGLPVIDIVTTTGTVEH
jgi:hypothetical protein